LETKKNYITKINGHKKDIFIHKKMFLWIMV